MRNPQRIRRVLDLVGQIWLKSPDLRLGQLISNAAMFPDAGSRDLYYIEDAELEHRLEEYLHPRRTPR